MVLCLLEILGFEYRVLRRLRVLYTTLYPPIFDPAQTLKEPQSLLTYLSQHIPLSLFISTDTVLQQKRNSTEPREERKGNKKKKKKKKKKHNQIQTKTHTKARKQTKEKERKTINKFVSHERPPTGAPSVRVDAQAHV